MKSFLIRSNVKVKSLVCICIYPCLSALAYWEIIYMESESLSDWWAVEQCICQQGAIWWFLTPPVTSSPAWLQLWHAVAKSQQSTKSYQEISLDVKRKFNTRQDGLWATACPVLIHSVFSSYLARPVTVIVSDQRSPSVQPFYRTPNFGQFEINVTNQITGLRSIYTGIQIILVPHMIFIL